jgi:hypothetical protein
MSTPGAERKRELYGQAHGLLEPGGLFLNWEHVAAGSTCSSSAGDRDLRRRESGKEVM